MPVRVSKHSGKRSTRAPHPSRITFDLNDRASLPSRLREFAQWSEPKSWHGLSTEGGSLEGEPHVVAIVGTREAHPAMIEGVKFPAGQGGKGNEGVANYVRQLPGAIGYVEYAYAKQNKLAVGQLRNKDGAYVSPTDDTFKAAAAGADWAKTPGMAVVLTNQPGAHSWPITGASFILLHTTQAKPENGREVLKFFDWAYKNGEKMADELDYVPMPDSVVKLIQAQWKKQIKDPSGKAIY